MNNVQNLPQGLQDAVEIIDFVFISIEKAKQAKADGGGINLMDLPKAFDLIGPAQLAVDGYDRVPAAWKAASDEEKEVVYNHFADKFDLENDVVEAKVEKAVRAGYLIADLLID